MFCKFCQGEREVKHNRCTGCGDTVERCTAPPPPPKLMPCPMCGSRIGNLTEHNTRQVCRACGHAFDYTGDE